MIGLTDAEIINAEIGAYTKAGLPVTDIMRYANIENRGVARAAAKKVVEHTHWHLLAYGDKTVKDVMASSWWQALLEEVK